MKVLLDVLGRTSLKELLQFDLLVGLAGCAGAISLAIVNPTQLLATTGVASQIIGVVLGAVVAGVAVQAAFLDQSFLRKLRVLEKPPVDYFAPFLFTIFIGVWALIGIVVLSAFSPSATTWILAVIAGITAFLSFWSLASILPAIGTLVQFIELRDAAVDVPEQPDIDQAGRRTGDGRF